MIENRNHRILQLVKNIGPASSREVFENLEEVMSYATLKRALKELFDQNLLTTVGKNKSTKYKLSDNYELIYPIDMAPYFEKEIDERNIIKQFNQKLISNILSKTNLFTAIEFKKLNELHEEFCKNISQLSENERKKALEHLAIDLSWKSSQIEGNTYTLLETEQLLRDKETAAGRTKEEAVMLLNHKEALDFIIQNPDYLHPVTISKIEDIHHMLTKELDIDRHIRKRKVGISGTNYAPIDNEFQIIEALEQTCNLINQKENIFEKALLALMMLSYIQPFVDGNKRTARIVSNAILMNYHYCPLSFRTVDSIEYKKAMLLFYEQNNIHNFKQIFITQYEFAVKTYF